MYPTKCTIWIAFACLGLLMFCSPAAAQLVDNTQSTNAINAGINKSFVQEVGAGQGDVNTTNSSMYIIRRDPFCAIRRGRQLFQRKFTVAQGQGPRILDGIGNINDDPALARDWPIAVRPATAVPGVRQASAVTSPPGRTAGMRPICLGSA